MEVKISRAKSNNWVEGTTENGFIFQAKLFDEPSVHGINEGYVSKLSIRPQGKTWAASIVNYDRGWDRKPKTASDKEVFKAVLSHLENTIKRFS